MASAKQMAARAKFKKMVQNKSTKVGKAAASKSSNGGGRYSFAKKSK